MMAGQRRVAERREPGFEVGPAFHVDPTDRPAAAKPRKPRRKSGKSKKSRRKRGSLIARTAYWALVLMLWLGIGGIGAIVWVGAHLPPIQSLEIPKRPPSIQIV